MQFFSLSYLIVYCTCVHIMFIIILLYLLLFIIYDCKVICLRFYLCLFTFYKKWVIFNFLVKLKIKEKLCFISDIIRQLWPVVGFLKYYQNTIKKYIYNQTLQYYHCINDLKRLWKPKTTLLKAINNLKQNNAVVSFYKTR